nr:hypothetical protein [Tanacetum cinerariifolium]
VGEMTFLLKDTTEITLETKKIPVVGDPFGQPPDVGGVDDHVMMDEMSAEGQYVGSSGTQGPAFVSAGVSAGTTQPIMLLKELLGIKCSKAFPLPVMKIPLLEYFATFADSYKAPLEETGKGPASESSIKKKGRIVVITTEDMQKRRNDVKARTTLLLALLDEHQLRFSKYKTAQELWEAILKTFGGNEATKKTKKNQLKQQYGNFKADRLETLEQTFNRLQAIVSHLEFMNVEIEQDDLNQKFLTSLAPEWLMYTIVWKNRD